MKISSIVGKDKLTLSFEVFPPKTDSDFEKVKEAAFGVEIGRASCRERV